VGLGTIRQDQIIMPQTTRTFVAIAVPERVGQKLVRLQTELGRLIPQCRWTASLPFHATLAFLGDVRDHDLNDVCKAVETGALTRPASNADEAFKLELQGLGAFPSAAKARVIWAGMTAPNLQPLLDLQQSIIAALDRAGYRPDDRRFHPHVTLGRIKSSGASRCDVTDVVERFRGWSGGSFRVAEITTFASTLGPDGPTYAPLGRARLRTQNAGP
jgi:RNA 2',3'-cyclic 3'-phosphodiesterase